MQPSAASNQRDASQVASIHLSKNKSIELDNVRSWVLSHKTTGWMRILHIFFLYSFCHDTIRNDLKAMSQYETITKFWKWSAVRVIIKIKVTESFVLTIFG